MKKTTILSLTCFLLSFLCPQILAFTRSELNSPAGYWLTIDDKTKQPRAVVQIKKVRTKQGIRLRGKTIAPLYIAGTSWRKNCTGCIAPWTNQPIKGMTIMYGYRKSAGQWLDGKIFDVSSNKNVYTSKIWLIDSGKKLKLRGYVFVFYRTQTWQRLTASEVNKYITLSNKQIQQHPLS